MQKRVVNANNYCFDYASRIEKFTQVHARGYVLAMASLHGTREHKVFSTIQSK